MNWAPIVRIEPEMSLIAVYRYHRKHITATISALLPSCVACKVIRIGLQSAGWSATWLSLNPKECPPAPAEIDRRPLTDDYRSYGAGTVRQSAVDDDPPDRFDMRNHYEVAMNTGTNINLRKLQEQLDRQPLDEIAMLVQALTYGEMIELAEGMWKVQPEGSAVTQENLPALLHRWSKSRSLPADEIRQDPGAV